MYDEPEVKRAVAFIDGSNTRVAARKAFGEAQQNFNPLALAQTVCEAQGWRLAGVYFYLGVPDVRVTEDGHYAWMKRCARWRKQGVHVFTRTLLQDDQGVAREKGIDMRLALDAVDLHRKHAFDVAILFSQDQDFSELAAEIRTIARQQKRWIQVASAFPWSDKLAPANGVSGTQALALDEVTFAAVLDSAENRRLSFTPDPLPAYPLPLPVDEEAEPQPAPPRRGPVWFAVAAGVYLFAAALTFGDIMWRERAALGEGRIQAAQLLSTTARAMVWPVHWLSSDDFSQFSRRLAEFDRPAF